MALLDGPPAPPSFVEGLARWLDWTTAIPLSAALNGPLNPPPPGRGGTAATAEAEFDRVRAALARAIDAVGAPAVAERSRGGRPSPAPVAAGDDGDFAPHRRRYTELQQTMEAAVAALRATLRDAAARQSPALARLAALDAVMAEVLGEREQALLAMMPSLLQRHFDRLLAGPAPALATAASPASPPPRPPAAAALAAFRQDMQRLLRAELELRLEPVQGLLDALRSPPSP